MLCSWREDQVLGVPLQPASPMLGLQVPAGMAWPASMTRSCFSSGPRLLTPPLTWHWGSMAPPGLSAYLARCRPAFWGQVLSYLLLWYMTRRLARAGHFIRVSFSSRRVDKAPCWFTLRTDGYRIHSNDGWNVPDGELVNMQVPGSHLQSLFWQVWAGALGA